MILKLICWPRRDQCDLHPAGSLLSRCRLKAVLQRPLQASAITTRKIADWSLFTDVKISFSSRYKKGFLAIHKHPQKVVAIWAFFWCHLVLEMFKAQETGGISKFGKRQPLEVVVALRNQRLQTDWFWSGAPPLLVSRGVHLPRSLDQFHS